MQLQKNDIVFHNWKVNSVIGSGSFGTVYEIEREEFGRVYKAAAKVITIPDDSHNALLIAKEGMTEENAIDYYKSLVDDVMSECDVMERMKGDSHIVSYEDHYVEEKENGKQWVIYIRMELLKPLVSFITDQDVFLEQGEILRIGSDICKGLEVCQKLNVIHRDIKLENIFVSDTGNYKLGDFGISKIIEESELAVSQKGTKLYMAPEMLRGEKYDATVDIYSLGLVLYRLLNHNRAPFMPEYPKNIHVQDRELALQRRLSGEEFPIPSNADEKLVRVLQKACSFDAAERYQTAYEMRVALEKASRGLRNNGDMTYTDYEKTSQTIHIQGAMGKYSFANKKKDDNRKKSLITIGALIVMLILLIGVSIRSYQKHLEDNLVAEKQIPEIALMSETADMKVLSDALDNSQKIIALQMEKQWMIVPDVLERLQENATQLLLDAGYLEDAIIIVYDYSNDVPSGRIIAQSIEPSSKVKKGGEIQITVSLGNRPTYSTSKKAKAEETNIKWEELE